MAAWRDTKDFGTSSSNPFEEDDFEEIHSAELSRIKHEKQLYEKRMFDSTQRSMRLIEESKDVACKTEEELARQEESLLRTETTLDKINGDLDVADRQLTSLKSIWGTIGNYFRKPVQTKAIEVPHKEKRVEKNPTVTTTEKIRQQTKGPNIGWEEKKDVFGSQPSNVNVQLDKNLDSMMSGLSELKGHALLMGNTLDRHDDIIDRVTYKTTRVDDRVESSSKELRKILKK
ncbi:synaptosomal-associated protein 29-like [Rhopilema esculentum]|uniref:synaptosomal-associated protein 29-like n=1 Tax=Rhopilema esculentum TaxID=499914 RepID=UPI0031E0F107|eukprot:gene15835-7162_t